MLSSFYGCSLKTITTHSFISSTTFFSSSTLQRAMASLLDSSSLALNNLTTAESMNTPEESPLSPFRILQSPSILMNSFMNKPSIGHQDAEVSIADANDCLRMASNKIEWFHRKYSYCPHLTSADDVLQITKLLHKILIEEVPFLELQARLQEGLVVNIPRELQGRVTCVCQQFEQVKNQIDVLVSNIGSLESALRKP